MLSFPNKPTLETIRNTRPWICYPIFGNRIVTEEYMFETVSVQYIHAPSIALTVQDFDPKKLSANYKYSTPSYTFASVEFFASGYFLGHAWLTKQRQLLSPDVVPSSYGLTISKKPPEIILPFVTANGFIPCQTLLDNQPDPNDPNKPRLDLDYHWFSYLIKPKPEVTLYIEAP